MLRDVAVVLDPPPNGVFTFEDTITGKVTFETHRDEKLSWCEVFFHGWANTHVVKQTGNYQQGTPTSSNYKDKEVLLQTSLKCYEGNGQTLQKNVRYEWPFQFDFRSQMDDATSLPSSGKYGNSSVEYKVIAIPVSPAQAANCEDFFQSIMNPNDQQFQKESPLNLNKAFLFAAKHLGGAAEQELQFVKIRREGAVDGSLMGPFESQQLIGAHHLPQIQLNDDFEPQSHGLLKREPHIPFQVDLKLPRNIIEGAYFPLWMSVTSPIQGWANIPPQVTLLSLKIQLDVKTVERASAQSTSFDYKLVIFGVKGLNIPLNEGTVDLGQMFPIRVTGDGIVPSFDTRLLARDYRLLIEATIEVAGKQFHTKFADMRDIELLSRHIAVGRPQVPRSAVPVAPRPKVFFQLQSSYIGRITQDNPGVIKEASVLETALAVSRALTKYEVPHEFPGGSLVKLLPYRFDRHRTNTSHFDKMTDKQKVETVFVEDSHISIIEPTSWEIEERLKVLLRYTDPICNENMSILFPSLLTKDDAWQKDFAKQTRNPADAVKIDPVSLFNYRLSCAITREKLSEEELGDFLGLYSVFSKDLHHHRKHIDVNSARLAVERYPQIETVLLDIGVDISKGKGKEPQRMAAPPVAAERGVEAGYEEDLVKGMKKHSFFHRKH